MVIIVIDEIRRNPRRGLYGRGTVVGKPQNKVYWTADSDMDVDISEAWDAENIDYVEGRTSSTRPDGFRPGVRLIRESREY